MYFEFQTFFFFLARGTEISSTDSVINFLEHSSKGYTKHIITPSKKRSNLQSYHVTFRTNGNNLSHWKQEEISRFKNRPSHFAVPSKLTNVVLTIESLQNKRKQRWQTRGYP
jgi:hypothetical protein